MKNATKAFLVFVFALMTVSAAMCQQAPDWSKRTFAAPPERVFAAALNSIAAQHHDVKAKDPATGAVTFHVGTTAWSWGYNMVLKVAPASDNQSDVTVEIARSGGKAVSWGSGKKEVQKIFNGIQNELDRKSGAS
ncbi:MAG TPA: hypothetical protein VKQ11_15045 [Candidatus Sulfotelmatobacter sp.]|nr:hypothetical protein [Candidatus Sulfotelmatobacter sp.]